MATVLEPAPTTAADLAPLRNGDLLDQATFHRRYEAMPEDFRAELIGGIVFVASPVSQWHAKYHARVVGVMFTYEAATAGVELLDNGTVIIDDENEPQPDAVLRIDDDYAGRSRSTDEKYISGPPELHVEVAYSSESLDLHLKLQAYEQAGVGEYLVVIVRDKTVRSFLLVDDAYVEQPLQDDRIWRSQRFPGLWLDAAALFENRTQDLLAMARKGIDSDEARQFRDQLASRRTT